MRFTGPDGKRHTAGQTFATKQAAEAALERERRLIEHDPSGWLPPKRRAQEQREREAAAAAARVTFGTFAAQFLAHRPLRPRTRDEYARLLQRHLMPAFGMMPLADVTLAMVRAWHADMGTATPTQRARAYGLLRTIFTEALREGLVTTNPAQIRAAGDAPRTHEPVVLTLEQLHAVAEAMPEQHRVLVLLSAYCALRFGEATELRRKDIDLRHKVVKVRRGVVRSGGEVLVGPPKTGAGVRDVAIPGPLVPLLRDHIDRFAAWGHEGLVFPGDRAENTHLAQATLMGKPSRTVRAAGGNPARSYPGRGFYGAREAAGVPFLRWHDLRHTGAVLAARHGATLADLMGRLGHSTPIAAMRYQHSAAERDQHLADLMGETVGPLFGTRDH